MNDGSDPKSSWAIETFNEERVDIIGKQPDELAGGRPGGAIAESGGTRVDSPTRTNLRNQE